MVSIEQHHEDEMSWRDGKVLPDDIEQVIVEFNGTACGIITTV